MKSIVIIGPTASGKTTLAHKIAQTFHLKNIINLDAFQIYKNMDIGTAKPNKTEQELFYYHLIDILEPHQDNSPMDMMTQSHNILRQLNAQQKVPLTIGGSGLYVRHFLHGLNTLPAQNLLLRRVIRSLATQHGWPQLHQWLYYEDSSRAQLIHPNDGVRIERALEIFLESGQKPSDFYGKQEPLNQQPFLHNPFVIRIDKNLEILKQDILKRIHAMLTDGWAEEVRSLIEKYGDQLVHFASMKAIGYLPIYQALINNRNINIDEIFYPTWHYSKRQMTWFHKEKAHFLYQDLQDWESLAEKLKIFLNP